MSRPPSEQNPLQRAARERAMEASERIATVIDEGGGLTSLSCFDPDDMNYDDPIHSIDNRNSHNYYKTDGGRTIKNGCAYSGQNRVAEYMATYEQAKEDYENGLSYKKPSKPEFVSAVDLDNLQPETEAKVLEVLLKEAKNLTFPEHPKTFRHCMMLDLYGLPIGTQFIFWSVTRSTEECQFRGGNAEIQGWLKRLLMLMVESGIPRIMKQRGVTLSGQANELFGSRVIDWALVMFEDIGEADEKRKRAYSEETLARMSSEPLYTYGVSSWAPGVKAGHENRGFFTEILMNMTFGPKGTNWDDTLHDVPVANPRNGAEMFGRDLPNYGFDMNQLGNSMDEKDAHLRKASRPRVG